jgi:hypothetical protein
MMASSGCMPAIIDRRYNLNAFVTSLYDIQNSIRMKKFASRFITSFGQG